MSTPASMATFSPAAFEGWVNTGLPKLWAASATALASSSFIGSTPCGGPTMAPVNSLTPSAPAAIWRVARAAALAGSVISPDGMVAAMARA